MTREEGGRNGEKWVETGRSGENNHPPHRTGPYWKNTGRSGRSGSNMGDTGITRELYGSNTAQSGITRGNTGEHLRPHSHVVEPGLWIFLPQLGKQVVSVSEEESPVGTIPWPHPHLSLYRQSISSPPSKADVPVQKNRSCGHRAASFAPHLAPISENSGGRRYSSADAPSIFTLS